MSDFDLVKIGEIVNVRGLHGEMKIKPWVDLEHLDKVLPFVFIDNIKFDVEHLKLYRGLLYLKLFEIKSVETANFYRNKIVLASRKLLGSEAEIYDSDLIDFKVYDENGELIGLIDNVVKTGATDVYSVLLSPEFRKKNNSKYRDLLLPASDEVVKNVDIRKKEMIVEILSGLLE